MPTSLGVSGGGVQLPKTVIGADVTTPTVVYAIASTRGDPVGVVLLDEVPDGVPSDVFPVHDDSDSEGWRIYGEGRLEYSTNSARSRRARPPASSPRPRSAPDDSS